MAYFLRASDNSFRATEHVSGAWDVREQHIAPAIGLLAHVVEADRDRRGRHDLELARMSYDIWGTVPVETVKTRVEVRRPGRTVELVEAELIHAGRTIVTMQAWLMQPRDTSQIAASPLPPIPGPDETPAWDPREVWPGGFIESVEVRRVAEPGRGHVWVRTDLPLVAEEDVSALASAAGLFDIANGMAVRHDPRRVGFPNVDLTAHLFRQPAGGWVGFDISVSFGAGGLGLTSSVLHDVDGPIGTMAQMLTVRPG